MTGLLAYNWFWLLMMGAISILLVVGLWFLSKIAKTLDDIAGIMSGFLECIVRAAVDPHPDPLPKGEGTKEKLWR